eukprot:1160273-Pelagomonas_calceolata.AAC.8
MFADPYKGNTKFNTNVHSVCFKSSYCRHNQCKGILTDTTTAGQSGIGCLGALNTQQLLHHIIYIKSLQEGPSLGTSMKDAVLTENSRPRCSCCGEAAADVFNNNKQEES